MPTKPTWDDVADAPTWDDVVDVPSAIDIYEAEGAMAPQSAARMTSQSTSEIRGAEQPFDFGNFTAPAQLPQGHAPIPASMVRFGTDEQMAEARKEEILKNRPSRAEMADEMAKLREFKPPTYRTEDPFGGGPRLMDDIVGNDLAILNQVWKGLANVGQKATGSAIQALQSGMAAIPPTIESGFPGEALAMEEWQKRRRMTPLQRRELDQQSEIGVAGQALKGVSDETHSMADPESVSSQVGQAIGGFFPAVATGPAAPIVFGLQAAGEALEASFNEAIANGKTPDEAAQIASRKSLLEGAYQGLLMKFFPHQAKKLGDKALEKLLGTAMEETLLARATRIAGGRIAQGIEGGVFGGLSGAGSNLIQGRPVEEGIGSVMGGMSAIQMLMRRGATKGELERRGVERNDYNMEMARIANDFITGKERVLLPEHQELLQKNAEESGKKVRFADLGDRGLAQPSKDGSILVDEVNLARRLAELPSTREKNELLNRVFNEEVIHSPTSNEQAVRYFQNSSSAEQQLAVKRYYGDKLPEGFNLKNPKFQSDVGHEMIRARVQQMQGHSPTEIAMEVGFNKSKVRGLVFLENAIWKMRMAYTKAKNVSGGPIVEQQKMLDNVLLKINQAKEIIAKIPEAQQVAEVAKAPVEAVEPAAAKEAVTPAEVKSETSEPEVTKFPVETEGVNKDWKLDTSDYGAEKSGGEDPFSVMRSDAPMAQVRSGYDEKMKFAREVLEMSGPEFRTKARSFNDHNIDLGLMATKEDAAEIKRMADTSKERMDKALKAMESDPSKSQEMMDEAMKWQFYNEAYNLASVVREKNLTYDGRAGNRIQLTINSEGPHKGAQFTVPDLVHSADIAAKADKTIEAFAEDAPKAYHKGMSKKQFLEEKARQLKAAFLEGKGEEVPPHLASAGMPKNKGGESFEVPPEERVSTGFKRLEGRDIQDAAWDELGRDIKIKNKDYSESQVRDFNVDYDRPNFQRFAKKMRDMTVDVSSEQLAGIWTDKVWSMLIKATPERLAQLRKALGLEGRFGRRELGEDPLGRGSIGEYSEIPDITKEQFADRRRSVLSKRIDKLEERAKQKLADADKWSASVSESEKEAAKDELFGPPGKGSQLRQEAAELTRQAQMMRYALSKASTDTLAKAYQQKDRRAMAQLPIGTITEQAKETAANRVDALRKEMKTASPERLIAIGKEMEGLAKMISKSENISSAPGRPAERTGAGATATAVYRQKVVRAIAHQLIGEAFKYSKERAAVDRKEISLEEIDFNNKDKDSIPYYEITPGDLEMMKGDTTIPFRLMKILRNQARAKNTDLESASRRVVVVVGPDNVVHILSTYNDGGIQRVTDPNFRGEHKPYRELNQEFLKKYHPIASLLLKDPVKGLNQQFAKVSEYLDRIGTEARKNSEFRGDEQMGLAAELHDIEGTRGIEGELGSFQGPARDVIDFGPRNPTLLKETPLSRAEAFAVAKYSNSTSAVRGRIDELKKRAVEASQPEVKGAKSKKLTPREILEINAFRKISEQIESGRKMDPELTSNPARSEAEVIGRVAERIMDAGMWGTPVKNLVRSFGQKKPGTFEPERAKRELTMRGDIRPPTSQRERLGPFQSAEAPGAEMGLRNPKPYIPESIKSEPTRQTEAEAYAGRKMEVEQNWAAAFRNKAAEQESGAARAKRIRERIFRKKGVLPSKAQAAKLADYEGPMSRTRADRMLKDYSLKELKELHLKLSNDLANAHLESEVKKIEWGMTKVAAFIEAKENNLSPRYPEKFSKFLGDINKLSNERRFNLERQGEQQSFPESRLRNVGKFATDAIQNWGSRYDEWMVDRLTRHGGDMSRDAGVLFRHIIDREKELYGQLTPMLDKARILAGGTEKKKWIGQVPTAKALKAVNWANEVNPIPGAEFGGISNVANIFDQPRIAPGFATELVQAAKMINLEVGKMLERVIPGFKATGKFQRNINSFGYDILKEGRGDMWRKWVEATAKANNMPIEEVREWFRKFKAVIDTPGVNIATIEKVNQDFTRAIPIAVTHLRSPVTKMWEPVIHSDMFSYLENTARRASHLTAFREQFPATPDGFEKLANTREAVKAEMGNTGQEAFDNLVKTMQGLPTDNYTTGFPGQTFRTVNSTIGNLMAKLALTGQMFVQPGETITGATPVFLGYRNYLRGIAKAKEMYDQMEQRGEVNRVMYDFSMNKNSPARSAFRIAGNTISKVFAEQWFNEMQETFAASTAQVVADRIAAKTLTKSEKRLLPQTFKAMGFSPDEVVGLMQGDAALLGQFRRKASAWLTSGNKAIAEGSSLGANRLFGSVLRFQSYPMMKANQLRKVTGSMAEAWTNGTAYEKKRSTELWTRFMFGAAAQGVLTTAITAAFYGGAVGLKTALNEAKDAPLKFLTESMLSTISGPLYLAWRGMKYKGVKGVTDSVLRIIFPYSILTEFTDMSQGAGRYRNQDWSQRIGSFINARIPGTRPMQQALAMTGLSQDDKKLDAALEAMYRWKRDTFGFDERRDYLIEDPLERKFRVQMRKAVDALKRGDQEKFLDAYIAAAENKMERGKGDSITFSNRKVLRNAKGSPLTLEEKEALRKRIGDDAYERLEYYDLMLEAAGDGAAIPPLD